MVAHRRLFVLISWHTIYIQVRAAQSEERFRRTSHCYGLTRNGGTIFNLRHHFQFNKKEMVTEVTNHGLSYWLFLKKKTVVESLNNILDIK